MTEHRCPRCGIEVSPDAAVCGGCQSPLGAAWPRRAAAVVLLCILPLAGLIYGGLRLHSYLDRGFDAQRDIESSAAALAEAERQCSPACLENVRQARVLLTSSRDAAAAGDFETAKRSSKEVRDALSHPGRYSPQSLSEADAAMSRGDFQAAYVSLKFAAALKPDDPEVRSRLEQLKAGLLAQQTVFETPRPPAPEAPEPPKPKWPFEMVLIPAGEFMMGAEEGAGLDDERPRHSVYLDAYHLARRVVTVSQFRRFAWGTGRLMPPQPSWNKDSHPVVNVSWKDALDFCRHHGMRLPTEAEWEKPVSGLDTRTLYADMVGRYNGAPSDRTLPAGQPPHINGLDDMLGTVRQWTADWYNKYYYDKSPRQSPAGPKDGEDKVARGCGWDNPLQDCEFSRRSNYSPGYKSDSLGLRCAASAN